MVRLKQNLPVLPRLGSTKVCGVKLDIEMVAGTSKTYWYSKTVFDLNEAYGWRKFIVVVPSIAIREGVTKSLQNMDDHFLESCEKSGLRQSVR